MAKKLYEDLGVEETATPEEIKRAYKRRASKHHPDKGGDKEEFQKVEKAYRVLCVAESRKRYDETGDERSVPPQSRESRVIAQLIEGFLQLLEQIDTAQVDIIKAMHSKIDGTIGANQDLEKKHHRKITQFEKAAKRIRRKTGGENFLVQAIEAAISREKGALANIHSQIEDLQRMDSLMKEFMCEKPPVDLSERMSAAEERVLKDLGFFGSFRSTR